MKRGERPAPPGPQGLRPRPMIYADRCRVAYLVNYLSGVPPANEGPGVAGQTSLSGLEPASGFSRSSPAPAAEKRIKNTRNKSGERLAVESIFGEPKESNLYL